MEKKNQNDKSTVHQPHDKLVKRLLSDPATAKEIFSLYLPPEVRALVNLNNLVLQRDSFIDHEHRAFAVDLLFKTTFKDEEGYLWILLEHQRKDDPWLPVRIFKYIATIWEHVCKTVKKQQLPLIYPIILYNGTRPYSSSLTLKDLIQPAESRTIFENLFNNPFCLIDLTSIADETLRANLEGYIRAVSLLLTLKHIFDKNLQTFFEKTLVNAFKKLDRLGNRDEVADMLYYLLNEGEFLDEGRFWSILHQEFNPDIEERMMTIAQKLEARGIEKGMEKGIEKGLLQGKIETAKALLKEGVDILFIAKITGLSIQKINDLVCIQ